MRKGNNNSEALTVNEITHCQPAQSEDMRIELDGRDTSVLEMGKGRQGEPALTIRKGRAGATTL